MNNPWEGISESDKRQSGAFSFWASRLLVAAGYEALPEGIPVWVCFHSGVKLAQLHEGLRGKEYHNFTMNVTKGVSKHAAVCRAHLDAVLDHFKDATGLDFPEICGGDFYAGANVKPKLSLIAMLHFNVFVLDSDSTATPCHSMLRL